MKNRIAALMLGLFSLVPMAGQADPYRIVELAELPQYPYNNESVSENGEFAILPGKGDIPGKMWSARDGVSLISDFFDENFVASEINNSGKILGINFRQIFDGNVASKCTIALHSPGTGADTILDFEYPIEPETYGQSCVAHLNNRGHVVIAVTDRLDPNAASLETPLITRFFRFNGSSTAEFHSISGTPGVWKLNNKDQIAITNDKKIKRLTPSGAERVIPLPGVPKKYASIQAFKDDGQLLVRNGSHAYSGPKQRRTFDIGSIYDNGQDPFLHTSAGRIVGTHIGGAFVIDRNTKAKDLDCLIPNSSRLSFEEGSQILPDGSIFAVAKKQDENASAFVRLNPTNDGSHPNYCVKSVRVRYGAHCSGLNEGSTDEDPVEGVACTVEVKVIGADGEPVQGADVRILGDGNVYTAQTNGLGRAVIGFTYQYTDCYTIQAPFRHPTLRTNEIDFPNCRYPV